MKSWLAVPVLFSLVIGMTIPVAYADVTSLELGRSLFNISENIWFNGTQNGSDGISVTIYDSNNNYQGLLSDLSRDQNFSTIPASASNFFKNVGTYNVTAFSDKQQRTDGYSILVEFDGDKIFVAPTYVMTLKSLDDVTVVAGNTVSFTAGITDSSVNGVEYSLEGGVPQAAQINSETGQFVWTTITSDGNSSGARYVFDIVATEGSQTDRESITITVNSPAPATSEPKLEPKPEPKPDPKPEPISNEPLAIPAPFVDEAKDPQTYVNRYNTEPEYKAWFDGTYPEYESIYEAVGLEAPKEPADFVDPNLDPQHYVDRYNNEQAYKDWFDNTYPDMTIYEAVGLETPREPATYGVIEPPAPAANEVGFGECGKGTELIGDTCMIVAGSQGGGCLIATAAYGTELAPQVQLLREVRDNTVMGTSSGAAFMAGFNQLYYSFSPTIADWERENPVFQEAVRAFITPMVSTLSIMTLADGGSEIQVLGLGISVIALNLGMYIAAPAIIAFKARKYIKT